MKSQPVSVLLHYYHFSGLTVCSNYHLRELIPIESDNYHDIHFTLEQPIAPSILEWFNTFYLEDGTPWQHFGKRLGGYVIRFHQLADFHISNDGSRIQCFPFYRVEMHTIRHLLLDNVLPHTLNLRGQIVLHASAVVTDKGAIIFLAPSGTGKSTLAAAFCQQGVPLLSDDSVVIDKQGEVFRAIPSYPGIRLWSHMVDALWQESVTIEAVAHYYSKKRIALHSDKLPFHYTSAPLRKIYLLATSHAEANEHITLSPVARRDAHIELVKHSFRMDITNKQQLAASFAFYNHLVDTVPLARLTYPRQLSRLAEVVTFLLQDV